MATRKKKVTRFRNTTGGFVGVVKYKPNGEESAIAVEPHGTVELTDEEIEATARAPREARDNPFEPQPFEVRDPNSDEIIETGERPFLVVDDEERTAPVSGSRGPTEEVGDPTAQKRRSRAKAGASA